MPSLTNLTHLPVERCVDVSAVIRGRLVIPLWPDAGEILGLSKNPTYAAANRGDIPGLLRFGSAYRVAVAPFLLSLGINVEAEHELLAASEKSAA